jgi:uncharacterized membrane protein HdeD (DUF308 family)
VTSQQRPPQTDIATQNTSSDALFGQLKENWGWLMALGIASIVLGTLGLGMSFGLTLASVMLFGALLLAGGVIQLVEAFKCRGWKSIIWHVLIALCYVLGGIAIMGDPVMASSVLTLLLAGALIGAGIVRIIIAVQHRGTRGWPWPLLGGVISILLGVMIVAKWPVSGLWVIGLFVAIELIFNGWSYVFLALAAKNAGKATAPPPQSSAVT